MNKPNFDKSKLDRLHDLMAGYVERREIPGIVTLLRRGGEVHVDAVGTLSLDGDVPMQRDTIFRIASMTKPIAAAAAMILVEEDVLRLDDPVDDFLPELANRRVLTRIDAPLDSTVPAKRAITLRDLLTFTLGIGAIMALPGTYPIQNAMADAGLAPGPFPPLPAPDDWMQRLGALPLVYQPGERWMYHTGSDVLGVLIARATGRPFDVFLHERIFGPLGMKDTSFHVPPAKLHRLPASYETHFTTGGISVSDDPRNSFWGRPPAFPSGGAGLVSTVDDYRVFCETLLNGGKPLLTRDSIQLMTTDHLTPDQRRGPHVFLHDSQGWGFGMGVDIRRGDRWSVPGRFGWDGGKGTSAWTDPENDFIGILMTQRLLESPNPPPVFKDFWTTAYQALKT